ncbi:fibronectin type III domain-containing protein, partial [bacterium]|nr:fibronectin type III domain-containing protein [bacterium]
MAAVNDSGTGAFSAASAPVTPATPTCGTAGKGCYDNAGFLAGGRALLTGGREVELVSAAGNFRVWREKNGSRILSSTGLWSSDADWQKTLVRNGASFTTTNFTTVSNIGGRACPPNVFLDRDNLQATDRCLYYDAGNPAQTLVAAKPSTGLGEAEDWLGEFTRPGTYGPGNDTTGASWYEGNVKTCADKGMRLPVLYETTFDESGSYTFPTEGGALPRFAGSLGVPAHSSGWTWTASAWTADANAYIGWNLGSLSGRVNWDGSLSVRCVIPSGPPSSALPDAPVSVTALPGHQGASVAWQAPDNLDRPTIRKYVVQYSGDDGKTWTTWVPPSSSVTSTEQRATSMEVRGLTNGQAYR